MLFNSYVFVLAFLPVVYLVARFLADRVPLSVYLSWLIAASVVFYSWQEPWLGLLFVASILFNYVIAARLVDLTASHRRTWLSLGVAANLALIGYFKYLAFGTTILNTLLGTDWPVPQIALPLGISFYTFVQIAYLVAAYRGEVKRHSFVEFSVFVTFFPHLVAGPIVQHHHLLEQFDKPRARKFYDLDFAVGVTYFSIGLFKKVILADQFAIFANPVFAQTEQGIQVSWSLAWIGLLSYSLQLYFDFSGYSDMAIGLGRLFGIKFPLNFNSPYKAVDIVDFWRRWHMTLSLFLRDHLYIPLGGSRCAPWRRSLNLFLTMAICGLWHGAGWTFVLWGAVHGALLIVNHAWNKRFISETPCSPVRLLLARGATFITVMMGWVLFRAETLNGAGRMYQALLIPAGLSIDYATWVTVRDAGHWVPIGLLIVWCLPNSQQFLGRIGPALEFRLRPSALASAAQLRSYWWQWRPTPWHALFSAGLFVVSFCAFSRVSQFIYFNF